MGEDDDYGRVMEERRKVVLEEEGVSQNSVFGDICSVYCGEDSLSWGNWVEGDAGLGDQQ